MSSHVMLTLTRINNCLNVWFLCDIIATMLIDIIKRFLVTYSHVYRCPLNESRHIFLFAASFPPSFRVLKMKVVVRGL